MDVSASPAWRRLPYGVACVVWAPSHAGLHAALALHPDVARWCASTIGPYNLRLEARTGMGLIRLSDGAWMAIALRWA